MSEIPKDFIDVVNAKSNYDNFSEEVEILKETSAGKMTLYTVRNKNGVTFQKVPGQPGLADRGFMGFVQSDRARPIMLSGSVRTSETSLTDNSGTTRIIDKNDDGGGGGNVDITPSVMWDVELTASAGALGSDTKTEEYYITVG